jgi:hypothetical protein
VICVYFFACFYLVHFATKKTYIYIHTHTYIYIYTGAAAVSLSKQSNVGVKKTRAPTRKVPLIVVAKRDLSHTRIRHRNGSHVEGGEGRSIRKIVVISHTRAHMTDKKYNGRHFFFLLHGCK